MVLLDMMDRDPDQEAIIIQQALKMKAPIPEKILNFEELLPGLEYYFQIYIDLCSDKSFGFGEGPVPWSAINEYAKRYKIEDDDFERLVFIIREADSIILSNRNKKQKAEIKSKSHSPISKGIKSK